MNKRRFALHAVRFLPYLFAFSAAAAAPDYVVVGGGIAGLTAAYRLGTEGYSVELIEKDAQMGGRLLRKKIEGYPYDPAAQFVCGSSKDYLAFIRDELGLASKLVPYPSKIGVYKNGHVFFVDYKKPWQGLARNKSFMDGREILRMMGKLPSLLKFFPAMEAAPDDFVSIGKFDRWTVEGWGERYLTPSLKDYLSNNIVSSLLLSDPNRSSVLTLFTGIECFSSGAIYTLRNGYGEVTETLFDRIHTLGNVRARQATVTRVEKNPDGAEVTLASGEKIQTPRVVLATPALVSAKLLSSMTDLERQVLDIHYSSAITLSLVIDKRHLPAYASKVYGLSLPEIEEDVFGSVQFRVLDADKILVQSFLRFRDPAHYSVYRALPDTEIRDRFVDVMGKKNILKLVASDIEGLAVDRWDSAIPEMPMGRADLLARYRERAQDDSIVLIGDYMASPGTSGAFTSVSKVLR